MSYTPYITKQIGRSTKLVDIPTEMLSQRIIFLGTEVDDYIANSLIQQMMWLATENDSPIDLYIQSPGGSVYAGLAILDCIDILNKKGIKVNTIGTGIVASMGAYLLAAGTGTRKATKNCRIMIHSVSSGSRGTIHDMTVDFNESKYLNDKLMVDIANFSKGKSTVEDIEKKCQRDWLADRETAEVKINEEVQASLQVIVDALIDAGNVTQTAHWNLRSSAFIAIHPWFGEAYDALFEMADAVAEQIKIANIDLMVNVNRGNTTPATNEQELFLTVQDSLKRVKSALDIAANDSTLPRSLQNLIDGWTADITKMIWFIEASTK